MVTVVVLGAQRFQVKLRPGVRARDFEARRNERVFHPAESSLGATDHLGPNERWPRFRCESLAAGRTFEVRSEGFGKLVAPRLVGSPWRGDLHPCPGSLRKNQLGRWDLGNDDLAGDDPGLEILDGGDKVVDEPAAGGIADALIGQSELPQSRTELV